MKNPPPQPPADTERAPPATEALAATAAWHTQDPEAPALLGLRCSACGSYCFPPTASRCRNPDCGADAMESVPLSRRGALWSYTTNHYPPPPPYQASEPFVPYIVAAVALSQEGMVVLGQVVAGVEESALSIGCAMEVTLGPLSDGERGERLVWQWRPVRTS